MKKSNYPKYTNIVAIVPALCGIQYGCNLVTLSSNLTWMSSALWPCEVDNLNFSDECTLYIREKDASSQEYNLAICSKPGDCLTTEHTSCIIPSPVDCPQQTWLTCYIQSSFYVGGMFGAVLGSRFINPLGLVPSMLLSNFGIILTTIGSMISRSYMGSLWARVATGIGVGCFSTSGPQYIAQLAPYKTRGVYISVYPVFISIGLALPFAVALGFEGSPTFNKCIRVPNIQDWIVDTSLSTVNEVVYRAVFGIQLVTALATVLVITLCTKKEPPGFYVRRDRIETAKEQIEKICGVSENPDERLQLVVEKEKTAKALGSVYSWQMFSKPDHRNMLLSALTASFLMQACGVNAIGTVTLSVLNAAKLDEQQSLLMGSGMNVFRVVISLISISSQVIERIGRKKLFIYSGIVQTCGMLLACIGLWGQYEWRHIGIICAIWIYSMGFAAGFASAFWTWVNEIWTVETVSSGLAATLLFNWLGSVCCVVFSTAVTNFTTFFTVYFIINAVTILILICTMRETKGLGGHSPYIEYVKEDAIQNEELSNLASTHYSYEEVQEV